ncbi:MAG: methylated-DNA--[protein]-cysteine S-methyltransferase [Bacteroidales bacterium]|nr:methylated-DNA--[protein]-cysteine S-methyltransferase [Bacteroidales bacterium]
MTTAQYQSPLGIITMVSDGTSLTELLWAALPNDSANQDLPIFADTCRWLDLYFSGKKPDFTPPLAPQGTPFQQKVWRELLTIPYGQTTTYGAIARSVGCRSAQAIGQAVHRNPIAIIIPCHRVIGADGSLTGYASGLDIKQQLLRIENNLFIFVPQ